MSRDRNHTPPASRPSTIASLTGIRGVAALWVLTYHASLIFSPTSWWARLPWVEHGWSGVDLFFVLSGFILMHAHAGDFVQMNAPALRRFAWSRFTRVYPLNFVVVLLILLLMAIAPQAATHHPADHDSLWSVISTALILTVWWPRLVFNQPVWSLSAEVVGYLGFPLLARLLGRLRESSLLVAVLSFGSLVLIRAALHLPPINLFDTRNALMRMAFCFVGGAALCRFRAVTKDRFANCAGPAAIGATLAIILACASWRLSEALPGLYGLLILALSYQAGLVNRVLSSKLVLFLGLISFPLYLLHLKVLVWFSMALPGRLGLPLGFSACLALATGLHWWVERPLHRAARASLRSLRRFRPQRHLNEAT